MATLKDNSAAFELTLLATFYSKVILRIASDNHYIKNVTNNEQKATIIK